jgi:hypothetical protein
MSRTRQPLPPGAALAARWNHPAHDRIEAAVRTALSQGYTRHVLDGSQIDQVAGEVATRLMTLIAPGAEPLGNGWLDLVEIVLTDALDEEAVRVLNAGGRGSYTVHPSEAQELAWAVDTAVFRGDRAHDKLPPGVVRAVLLRDCSTPFGFLVPDVVVRSWAHRVLAQMEPTLIWHVGPPSALLPEPLRGLTYPFEEAVEAAYLEVTSEQPSTDRDPSAVLFIEELQRYTWTAAGGLRPMASPKALEHLRTVLEDGPAAGVMVLATSTSPAETYLPERYLWKIIDAYPTPALDPESSDTQPAPATGRNGDSWRTLAALTAASNVPALMATVHCDPAAPEACATFGHRCHSTAKINVNKELFTGDTAVVAGSLAHETAHLDLDHPRTGWRRFVADTFLALSVAAVLGIAVTHCWWILLAWAAVFVAVWVAWARGQMRVELAADARGTELLEAAGLDGRACMAAMLADVARQQTLGDLVAGWVLTGHPSAARRTRALISVPVLNGGHA